MPLALSFHTSVGISFLMSINTECHSVTFHILSVFFDKKFTNILYVLRQESMFIYPDDDYQWISTAAGTQY